MSQDAEVRQLREAFRQARDEAHLMRSSLVAEADALRAELQHVRQQAAQREAVRVEEREELVRAYEAMLGEQATAVAQQSARVAQLGSLSNEASQSARQRERELKVLEQQQQRQRRTAAAVDAAWAGTVSELEAALDAALAGRAALEADRVRLMALHRKKVGMVQREAEAKHEEALKANALLEEKAAAATAAAAKHGERAAEMRAREISRKAEAALRSERGHRERRSASLRSGRRRRRRRPRRRRGRRRRRRRRRGARAARRRGRRRRSTRRRRRR